MFVEMLRALGQGGAQERKLQEELSALVTEFKDAENNEGGEAAKARVGPRLVQVQVRALEHVAAAMRQAYQQLQQKLRGAPQKDPRLAPIRKLVDQVGKFVAALDALRQALHAGDSQAEAQAMLRLDSARVALDALRR
jgi:hypothetical protein